MAEESDSSEERTEQATTYRREEFRRLGMVAQSREVISAAILFGMVLGFFLLSKRTYSELNTLITVGFTDYFSVVARGGNILAIASSMMSLGVKIILPFLAIALIVAILASLGQVGFVTAWDKLEPDLDHINPLNGFQKIFSLRSAIEGLKSVIKIIVIGAVLYGLLKSELTMSPKLVQMSVPQIAAYIIALTFKLFVGVIIFMAVLAVLDYGFQWWDLEKRMKMTKQEVREEFKQREGDPLIKSRIKRIQRELAQKRMMEKVPKADVIITNPTHIAVALQYDREKMVAPTVVAKGADLIAQKIKEIAKKHNVPIVENKPLARAMYKAIKIGQTIPQSLYNAVAEVLAYVYRLKGRVREVVNDL